METGKDITTEEKTKTLRASVTENACENIRYRQDRLLELHSNLSASSSTIISCIVAEGNASSTSAAAELEFYLAMDCLRRSYLNLNFDQAMRDEYAICKDGKDNLKRRVAKGVVGIRLMRRGERGRFYGLCAVLAAALEAGCCILLELENTSNDLERLLADVLPQATDPKTLAITTTRVNENTIDILVDQTDSSTSASSDGKLLTALSRSTIAVVDRSANVHTAAKLITLTKIQGNYGSPYAPDVVLVNEWVVEAFQIACLRYASENSSMVDKKGDGDEKTQQLIRVAEKEGKLKIHTGKGIKVLEIKDRSSPLANMKISGPYIVIISCTGIVDSITFTRSTPEFMASYLFASTGTCKFLAEQISSRASYINQIPDQLLFGPPSPSSYPHALHPRYTSEMFSLPRPQYINPTIALLPPPGTDLRKAAMKPLPPTGQPLGHALGFFEQGIFIGLGTTVLLVLPATGFTLYWAMKNGWRIAREMGWR